MNSTWRAPAFALLVATLLASQARAAEVELQPFAAQATRIAQALEQLGAPLPEADRKSLDAAMKAEDAQKEIAQIQEILDRRCLLFVDINPEARVKVARGPADAELFEGGWRTFLLRVINEAGVTAPLRVRSPSALPLHGSPKADVANRWLDILHHTAQPMQPNLSGLAIEYRLISLYSRDAGKREGKLAFDVGQGTQDLGFRGEQDVLFTCRPATPVTLNVFDSEGQPTAAAFVVRDAAGRIYPSQAKRLAPDFSFHPQVYRWNGETLKLPPGKYELEVTRGPESLPIRRSITVGENEPDAAKPHVERFDLKRWIDPRKFGWVSGDHHIHTAGCAHYASPTEGVHAKDVFLHCVGEDLKIGCNLTWGPCFDYQKQFFTGKDDLVSRPPYLLRYDVEVSGFGSHESGHLVLLRLKNQIPPGGDSYKHWPTLGLNTLKWAKRQGAVCGPAHSANGLETKSTDLPNYEVPPYNGIGAQEYIVDVTHQVPGPDGKLVPAIDFISLVDTPSTPELNMWYHTLNVGYRTRGSGETDFPCVYGERVGMGRSYVKIDGPPNFDRWTDGLAAGRSYISEGTSHLIDFKVDDVSVGENNSELRLAAPKTVRATAKVAALLDEQIDPTMKTRPIGEKPYWHLGRARLGQSREVPVELIVNGQPVARQTILADGYLRDISFETKIDRSSWIALRILPSSHTNPVFAVVAGKPINASRRSAEWCLKGVDQCWSYKQRTYKPAEMEAAKAAYDHARQAYRQRMEASDGE